MKKRRIFLIVILIVVLCMDISLYLTYRQFGTISRTNYENELRLKSGTIASGIDNCFLRPITVAETMSKDVTMRRILDVSTVEEAKSMEADASEYLKSIRDGFGYAMVFAVNDSSKAYFTYDGITKYLDPETVEADSWYQKFIDKDEDRVYDLDVDTDEVNNWALSVFVNAEVCDESGRLLGLCGVGVDMTELQTLIGRFERIYGVKITLIDHSGLIQVDTDAANIENAYIEIEQLENYEDGETYYEVSDMGSRTITYIENLDWFLVVQNNTRYYDYSYRVFLPGVVCLVVFFLMIFGLFLFHKTEEANMNKENERNK